MRLGTPPPERAPDGRPGRHRRPQRRLIARLRWGLLLIAVLAGIAALVVVPSSPDRTRTADPAPASEQVDSPPAPVIVRPVAKSTAVAERVRIPAIDVDSTLVELAVDDDGALVPPSDFAKAGWFAAGTVPGDVGPAVIAGHVDSYRGPAVFFRLEDLERGDRVEVTRSDGRTVRFTVDRVAEYAKNDFATDEVYGPTTDAQLRLITCGGVFDRTRRSYLDNIVVYATAT